MTYLSLDLTASDKRASAYAVLNIRGGLEECGTLRSDQDIHQWALKTGASTMGMDCPLRLPVLMADAAERMDEALTVSEN